MNRVLSVVLLASLLAHPVWARHPVVTSVSSPIDESVLVSTGSFSELVHFSGFVHSIVKIAIPTEPCIPGDPCRNVPYTVHLNLRDVNGVGAATGLRYRVTGAFRASGLATLPGGLSFQTDFRVRPPGTITQPIIQPPAIVPISGFVALNADGTSQQATLTTGLISYWAGDLDSSDAEGANPGTSMGNVLYAEDGQVNQSFRFIGSGSVEVAQSASLEPTSLTVAAWVRHNGKPASAAYIVSKGAQGCTAASYGLYTGAGNLLFYVFDGTGFVLSPDAGPNVWDGNWHFVAGSYDGHAVRLYVDGAEVSSGTPTSLVIKYGLSDNNTLYFGRYGSDACAGYLEADVDEIRLFNRALIAAEVANIYTATH